MGSRVTLHVVDSGEDFHVDVTPTTELREVLAVIEHPWAGFHPTGDTNPLDINADREIDPTSYVTLGAAFGVTAEGLLTMRDDLNWEDFGRASELIQGDPHELTVYLYSGAAGGALGELIPVVQWVWDNRESIKLVAESAVGLELAVRRPVLRLSNARRRAIAKSFRERGIASGNLIEFIDRRVQWDPARLGPLLDLTEREAAAALAELGYEPDGQGLYRLSESTEARARRAAYLANSWGPMDKIDENGNLLDPIEVEWE